jgi:hypothetical protein
MKPDYWRQLDFYRPDEQNHSILVAGCGHLGTQITMGLAMMGQKKITICDFDHVEAHNLPTQFFSRKLMENVGKDDKMLKVTALKATVEMMVPDCEIEVISLPVESIKGRSFEVIFICADGRGTPEYIYNEFRDTTKLFVDPRTGGQFFNVYSFPNSANTEARKYYEKSLQGIDGLPDLSCSGTAVIDVAMCCAGESINRYRLWCANKLQVLHSFHDMSIGGTAYIMQGLKPAIIDDAPPRNEVTIEMIGKQPVAEGVGDRMPSEHIEDENENAIPEEQYDDRRHDSDFDDEEPDFGEDNPNEER